MFNDIKSFTYTRPVKYNVQILNDSKAPAKRIPCCNKNSKNKHHYTTLAIILYATEPKNTISQSSLKHYNQFRSVITKALRWL